MKIRTENRAIFRTSWMSFAFSPRVVLIGIALALFILMIALILLNTGRNPLGFDNILRILWQPEPDDFITHIIWEIRLPRLMTALFAGAALGISGAIFQSISRNPLGSPDIIGFTTGAATGAIFYLIFIGQSSLGIALSAMISGLITAIVVYLLSMKFGTIGSYRLVLIGIGVGATLGALNGLMLVKGDLDSAIAANIWLAGSLNARQWDHAIPLAIGFILLAPLIWLHSYPLTLLEMGDDLAHQLGVKVQKTRLFMTFYAVMLASLSTAAIGPIAFIALAAPQVARLLIRAKSVPVFTSALMGSALLLSSDWLTLTLPFAMSFPIGLMTAFIGGLYLLWLVTRNRY